MASPSGPILGIGRLGRLLVLAFVAVALAGILIDSVLDEESVGPDITNVVNRQENALASAVVLISSAAYQGVGWNHANLDPVFDLAARAGAGIQIRDATGRIIGQSLHFASYPAMNERGSAIVVRGRQVGLVRVRFSSHGLGSITQNFEAEQMHARIVAAVVSALLAIVVSLFMTRLIVGPLDRMLEVSRARGAGDRLARLEPVAGVGVVRELLEDFNRTADIVDLQDRVRRNLVANVAHELRTPIAVLQAGHEAMLDGVSEPTAGNLLSLRDEVLRLARMVDDLQSLASAEAAALQMTFTTHDLARIAEEAAASQHDSYDQKGIELVTNLRSVDISCDEGRIREIVSNLLTNALKYTSKLGRVILTVAPADGRAILQVKDTGVGIPAEELPFVTERFFRGQEAAHLAAGSGFGLTIVSELVRAHHGQLDIASEQGLGTTVTVRLPLAKSPR
jgi:two-component system, OmpR family, sensor histidine kinase BaeS